jgi:hypothetical protein
MARTVTVTIEGGKATVQTEGFKGAACKDVTAALQKRLGRTESDDPTPEFHETEAQRVGN